MSLPGHRPRIGERHYTESSVMLQCIRSDLQRLADGSEGHARCGFMRATRKYIEGTNDAYKESVGLHWSS